ncbi:hypothetical protein [Halomicrococcus sp. NG-SE-24]|uniref:hypothetical protein n=1 Tax=Halomicrococcus sp. NG-SE-24 TaxID=3436928 RepID=UPI003D9958EE
MLAELERVAAELGTTPTQRECESMAPTCQKRTLTILARRTLRYKQLDLSQIRQGGDQTIAV